MNKTDAADLSTVFPSISLSDQHKLFEMIKDTEQKGVLFSELEEDIFLNFAEGMEIDEIVEILETMPTDDVADLIGRLPEEMSDTILEKMKKEGRLFVYRLPSYSPDKNPIEKLWRKTKKDATHCKYFPTFDALRSAVINAFNKYMEDAMKVVCVMKKLRKSAGIA